MASTKALLKDESILSLLTRLASALAPNLWQVIDHWDADRLAVGIASTAEPALLVYVSTYRQPRGRYFYECEEPPPLGSDHPYKHGASREGVTFPELVAVIREHLSGTR